MPNTSDNIVVSPIETKVNKKFNSLSWILIAILFSITVLRYLIPSINTFTLEVLIFPFIPIITFIHGTKRYGVKNMVIFFLITWLVSNFFESLSIYMGFPFGNYHYNVPGVPSVFEVPFVIMIAYFGMGYISWTLSHILNNQYGRKLQGIQIFLIPFIASFIMVMWDIVMDPINSTIQGSWIWENGGNYFGVPISNYFGWFFVVYVFMQIFAIYISKFDNKVNEDKLNKAYWFECIAMYGIQSINYLLMCITFNGNREIYSSMGLICVFTMVFVTIITTITVNNSFNLKQITNKLDSNSSL